MSRPTRFTIRSVCALTGVNPNTLRAWERRYGLVTPERTASGYRLYTMQDVERLRAIQDLLNAGVPAGQVAKHLPVQGTGASTTRSADSTPSAATPRSSARSTPQTIEEFATAVVDAALAGDDARADCLFSRSVGLFNVGRAFSEVLLMARKILGKNVEAGCVKSVEAKARLTAYTRKRLEKILAGLKPLHQRPLVVCAHTGKEDYLEGDLMQIALELGMARVSTSYVVAPEEPEPITNVLSNGSVRAMVMTCGACESGSPAWNKAAERLRGVKVHVVANGTTPDCEFLRKVDAGMVLRGHVEESAHSLLKSLGRA